MRLSNITELHNAYYPELLAFDLSSLPLLLEEIRIQRQIFRRLLYFEIRSKRRIFVYLTSIFFEYVNYKITSIYINYVSIFLRISMVCLFCLLILITYPSRRELILSLCQSLCFS